jgi:hypothetical protein
MAKSSKKNFKLDYTNFNRMMNMLAEAAGKQNTKKIIKSRLKAVLEKCVTKTKSSTASKIGKRFSIKGSQKAFEDAEVPFNGINYPQQSPDLIPKIRFEGDRNFRIPSDVNSSNFARVKKRLKGMRAKRLGRVGLAKSTFVFIAIKAGILNLKADKKAMTAFAKNPAYGASCTSVKHTGAGAKYTLHFETTSATVYNGTGGKQVIQNAIKGQEKSFAKHIKMGVLEDPKKFEEIYGFELD